MSSFDPLTLSRGRRREVERRDDDLAPIEHRLRRGPGVDLVERPQLLDLVDRLVDLVLGAEERAGGHQHEHVPGRVGDRVHPRPAPEFLAGPEIFPGFGGRIDNVVSVGEAEWRERTDDPPVVREPGDRPDMLHVGDRAVGNLLEVAFLALDRGPGLVRHQDVVGRVLGARRPEVGKPPLAEPDVEGGLDPGLLLERGDDLRAHELLEGSAVGVDDEGIVGPRRDVRKAEGRCGRGAGHPLEECPSLHWLVHLFPLPFKC